jgi:M6 family metalloprotease-like protein
MVYAQATEDGEQAALVKQLNGSVLRLHEQAAAERSAGRVADRFEGQSLIRRRGEALRELMRNDPAEAVKWALSADVLDNLRAQFPDSSRWLERSGVWAGTVQVDIMDDFEHGTSRTDVRMRRDGDDVLLHFDSSTAPQLQCSETLDVEGVRLGDEVAVRGYNRAAGQALASACTPTGPQSTLVILAKFPGYADSFSTSYAHSVIFADGSARSLNTYFKETSGGATSATGKVVGWLTLDKLYSCSDYVNMRLAAIRAADQVEDLTQYSRIVIFFPMPGSCSFGGVSTVGCTSISTSRGTSMASLSMLVADYTKTVDRAVQLASHEVGHGLGLYHSASRDFGAEPVGAIGTTGTISTYGDNFSTMGYWNLGHYAAQQKAALGWWSWGTQVQTVQSNGTYVIAPAEFATTAAQAIRVQRGSGNNAWLWLEYRQPTGLFDTTLPSQVHSGVLIHYEDSATSMTHLLDYSPDSANWNGPALAAGSVWKDPHSNLTLSVLSANASGASVNVSYGAEACSPQTPGFAVSPSSASVTAGGSVNYSITLKNNDSASCAPSSFTLKSLALPAGWTGSVSPSSASLSPGQSLSAQLALSTSSSTPTDSYTVGASASDGPRSVTATAGISVTQPATKVASPLVLTLTSSTLLTTTKSRLTFTIKATRDGQPVSSAPVTLSITKSTGEVTNYSAKTASNGEASLSLFLRTAGAYSATAQAADGNTTVSSETLSITVR